MSPANERQQVSLFRSRGQPPIPRDGRGEATTGRIAAGCAGLTSTLDSARTIIDGTTSSADLPAAIQRSPKWRATRRSGPSQPGGQFTRFDPLHFHIVRHVGLDPHVMPWHLADARVHQHSKHRAGKTQRPIDDRPAGTVEAPAAVMMRLARLGLANAMARPATLTWSQTATARCRNLIHARAWQPASGHVINAPFCGVSPAATTDCCTSARCVPAHDGRSSERRRPARALVARSPRQGRQGKARASAAGMMVELPLPARARLPSDSAPGQIDETAYPRCAEHHRQGHLCWRSRVSRVHAQSGRRRIYSRVHEHRPDEQRDRETRGKVPHRLVRRVRIHACGRPTSRSKGVHE